VHCELEIMLVHHHRRHQTGSARHSIRGAADGVNGVSGFSGLDEAERTRVCVRSYRVLRVNTHVAPDLSFSSGPPTMAVLPSADSATENP
jgi:hypothetical protein